MVGKGLTLILTDCYSTKATALLAQMQNTAMCQPSIYLTSSHLIQSPRSSPSEFVCCKYWRWEHSGNEGAVSLCNSIT